MSWHQGAQLFIIISTVSRIYKPSLVLVAIKENDFLMDSLTILYAGLKFRGKKLWKRIKNVESLLAIVIFSTNNYDFERDSN